MKIKIIGIGGASGNILKYIANKNPKNIELIYMDTNIQALNNNNISKKIELNIDLTNENIDKIKKNLKNSDIVFIIAGMGNETGTKISPIIAKMAKEITSLTISVVTTPFKREGIKRMEIAQNGIKELQKNSDALILLSNQKLLSTMDKSVTLSQLFNKMNEIFYQSIISITNMVDNKENNINIDLDDLKKVFSHKGITLSTSSHTKGENSALKAFNEILNSPFFEDNKIYLAKSLVINITTNEHYRLIDIDEAQEKVLGDIIDNEEIDIIMGMETDNNLSDDEIIITILASGI